MGYVIRRRESDHIRRRETALLEGEKVTILEGEKVIILEGKKTETTIKTTITICMYWVNPEFSGFRLMGWVSSIVTQPKTQPMVQCKEDHSIDLLKGTTSSFKPIYNLSAKKLAVL